MNNISFPRMHMSFYVSNLEKSRPFYDILFNQKPSKERPLYAKYEVPSPSLIISFIEKPEKVNTLFGHVGIQVATPEEVQNHLTRIKNAGLETREECGVTCCYAKQDKFWVTDPDGIQWEIYYFHEDAEFNDPRYNLNASNLEEKAVSTEGVSAGSFISLQQASTCC